MGQKLRKEHSAAVRRCCSGAYSGAGIHVTQVGAVEAFFLLLKEEGKAGEGVHIGWLGGKGR